MADATTVKPQIAVLEGVPEEWIKVNELLEECRHNFAAVHNPEREEEWKYLRSDSIQSWGTVFNKETKLTDLIVDESTRVWVPDSNDGFVEGTIVEKSDEMSQVIVRRQEKSIPNWKLQEPNPSAFDGCEDMAMLSYLNEASVLHNLKVRFKHNLIHTYSGLFCITVNPWRWLPIYSPKIILFYKGQTLNTMPPHIYAIADNVYNNMMEGDEDQSILITGESGAGKTENTKKIIQYFAIVAAKKYVKGEITLEEQLCESNPVLEAFGNAKSTHNDNSSRFGKFIQIWFTPKGKVNKAVIESYLLEKSRLISQASVERSYHIFYQLLSEGTSQELKELLYLTGEAKDYRYLKNGMSHVEDIDDAEQMRTTDRGLEILKFTEKERIDMFKMTASSLLLGQIRFRAMHKDEEQVSVESIFEPDQVCTLLGVDTLSFLECLTEPTVTVRGELVKQRRNLEQVIFSVAALSKSIYEKKFRWLVKRCNMTLTNTKRGKNWHFIGILDIAGFEIFDLNSFEQLCINYTNEKLQFFFNHQMFVREQDEYRLEGLQWEMIDFALDLQPTIDLIEKPMGILSMLEEECIMPKGSASTFLSKLNDQHLEKTNTFGRALGGPKANAHFSVNHYAAVVNYNVEGWLEKNKDPLNPSVVELFKRAKNPLLKEIWTHYGTTGFISDDPMLQVEETPKKSRKGGSTTFLTVSAVFREQLTKLLCVLNSTHPHFVRCVVPNYERKPGLINGPLVINQLRCNGVLEGLRIVSRGYPNRLLYEEFRDRFRILSTDRADWQLDGQTASNNICEDVGLQLQKDYDLGNTKLFVRVGILGRLELMRTAKFNEVITQLQAHVRAYITYGRWKLLELKREFVQLIQKTVRHWIELMDWEWLKLLKMVKPAVNHSTELMQQKVALVQQEKDDLNKQLEEAQEENERLQMENDQNTKERIQELESQLNDEREERKKVEDDQAIVIQEQQEELEQLRSKLAEYEEREQLRSETKEEECMTDEVFIFDADMETAGLLKDFGLLGQDKKNDGDEGDEEEEDSDEECQSHDYHVTHHKTDVDGRNDDEGIHTSDDDVQKLLNKNVKSLGIKELRKLANDYRDVVKDEQNRIGQLQSELNNTSKSLEEQNQSMQKLENKNKGLERDLFSEMEKSRKRENQLLKLQRQLNDITQTSSVRQYQLSSEVAELRRKVEMLTNTVRSQDIQLRETRIGYDKLLEDNREYKGKTESLQSNLQQEKIEKRRLERNVHNLEEDNIDLLKKIDEYIKKINAQARELAAKDKEISKLKDEMDRMAMLQEEALRDLRERHNANLQQLQEKNGSLHRKAIKLESENQQLKAQIYTEPQQNGDRRSLSLSRANSVTQMLRFQIDRQTSIGGISPTGEQPAFLMGRRNSRFSAEVDIFGFQIEDLERQKQELIEDKRIMRREIENSALELQLVSEERDNLRSQLKTTQNEASKLNLQTALMVHEKKELGDEIRHLKHNLMEQEHRTGELLLEKGVEMGGERIQSWAVKHRSTVESQQALNRVAGMERFCNKLQEEIESYKRGMRDAQNTIEQLEETIRSSRTPSLQASFSEDKFVTNSYED